MSEVKDGDDYPVFRLKPLYPQAERLATLEATLREWLEEKREELSVEQDDMYAFSEAGDAKMALRSAVKVAHLMDTVSRLERALGIGEE